MLLHVAGHLATAQGTRRCAAGDGISTVLVLEPPGLFRIDEGAEVLVEGHGEQFAPASVLKLVKVPKVLKMPTVPTVPDVPTVPNVPTGPTVPGAMPPTKDRA